MFIVLTFFHSKFCLSEVVDWPFILLTFIVLTFDVLAFCHLLLCFRPGGSCFQPRGSCFRPEGYGGGLCSWKQLEVARLKSNRSTTTASTLINTSLRSSAGSGSGTGTTSGTASGSGVAQTSTTLSTQIQKLKNAATAPRILGGGTIIRTTNYGSLITDDGTDNRCRLAHLRELYDQKLNVSTSFNPSSLSCSNCSSGPHQIIPLSGKGHSSPACFILSDQNFRVEDATLADLVSTFLMLTKGCDIGIRSVIVLSSLNHLGRVGIAAYSEDLCGPPVYKNHLWRPGAGLTRLPVPHHDHHGQGHHQGPDGDGSLAGHGRQQESPLHGGHQHCPASTLSNTFSLRETEPDTALSQVRGSPSACRPPYTAKRSRLLLAWGGQN